MSLPLHQKNWLNHKLIDADYVEYKVMLNYFLSKQLYVNSYYGNNKPFINSKGT